jgi:hypothetical protein
MCGACVATVIDPLNLCLNLDLPDNWINRSLNSDNPLDLENHGLDCYPGLDEVFYGQD